MKSFNLFSFLLVLPVAVTAFSVVTPVQQTPVSSSSVLHAETPSRRTFFANTAVATTAMLGFTLPSVAEDVDDLAMPSADEAEAQRVSTFYVTALVLTCRIVDVSSCIIQSLAT